MSKGSQTSALVHKGMAYKVKVRPPVVHLGNDLQNEREEAFCRLVCDGMSQSEAYRLAGFQPVPHGPKRLWAKPHIQDRAAGILRARAETGAVTLPQVTDMLQRVFAGSLASGEYGPAHNAAFSLARLYGLVIDRQVVGDLRRPSRDPDAPSEQALASWVTSLPGLSGPDTNSLGAPGLAADLWAPGLAADLPAPPARAPARDGDPGPGLEGLNPNSGSSLQAANEVMNEPSGLAPQELNLHSGLEPRAAGLEGSSHNSSMISRAWRGPGEFENGAPSATVTGTPSSGARTPPVLDLTPVKFDTEPPPANQKRVPQGKKKVGPAGRSVEPPKGVKQPKRRKSKKKKARKGVPPRTKFPSAKELFG